MEIGQHLSSPKEISSNPQRSETDFNAANLLEDPREDNPVLSEDITDRAVRLSTIWFSTFLLYTVCSHLPSRLHYKYSGFEDDGCDASHLN